MKTCTRCKLEKPFSDFSFRNGRQAGQLRSHCKKCASEVSIISQNKRKETDPEGYNEYKSLCKRRERRGLTEEQFENLGELQNWQCYICGVDDQLFLDHDHEQNVVRKLLCFHCNVGLGHFKDSTVLLYRASLYIQEHYD